MILVYHIYRVGCFVNIYQALIDQTVGKGVIFSFLIVCHRDKIKSSIQRHSWDCTQVTILKLWKIWIKVLTFLFTT